MSGKTISIEVNVDGLTVRREIPDAWSGDNPIFHAQEFNKVATHILCEIDDVLAFHFGDIRTRKSNP